MPWMPDYATAVELRDYLRISDGADDVALASAVGAASRAIDQACNRQFGLVAAPEARYYTASYDRSWVVPIDDLMTTVGMLVATDPVGDLGWTGNVTPTVLWPPNAAPNARPWTALAAGASGVVQPTNAEHGVRVTARWGWTAVPAVVKTATLLQASRLFARRDAPFGIAGSVESGSEMRLLARIDPDVKVLVRPYERVWGAI